MSIKGIYLYIIFEFTNKSVTTTWLLAIMLVNKILHFQNLNQNLFTSNRFCIITNLLNLKNIGFRPLPSFVYFFLKVDIVIFCQEM